MKQYVTIIKNAGISVGILLSFLGINLLISNLLNFHNEISALFIMGVFLISLYTDGYIWGISASIVSVIMVNFIFIRPFYAFDFLTPEKLVSALTMFVISVMTSTLTTKLKKQEKMRVESEREKMRADLLRALSHDLRTPLTSILGASSALLEGHTSIPRTQQTKLLQDIRSHSQWLIRMVENLLSVTRIDTGRISLSTTPVVVEELAESVLGRFHTRYPEERVLLTLPNAFVCVAADAMLIEQVLLNLLENAVLHAKGKTMLELKVTIENKHVTFSVLDDGCGIPKDKLDKLFTGTFSTQRPVDGAKGSMGIGLYVCSTIILAHGDRLTANNRSEGGCCFSFSLTEEDSAFE